MDFRPGGPTNVGAASIKRPTMIAYREFAWCFGEGIGDAAHEARDA
jgi:hypothetical protein